MPKLVVKSNIRHDGEDYAPGETIEVSAKHAEALVASGAVVNPKAEPQAAALAE